METPKSNINIANSLPFDVTLKITSSLSHQDVCAMGSCSRYWMEICRSDSIWISLSKKRWPSLFTQLDQLHDSDPLINNWRSFYAKRHKEIATTTTSLATYMDQCTSESNSIEVQGYRKLHEKIALLKFGFRDVVSFLFDSKQSVVLNLLGLHYSIKCLKVSAEIIAEALRRCNIQEREVKIEWTKLVRQNFQCTLVGETTVESFSLKNLAILNGDVKDEEEYAVFKKLEEAGLKELMWGKISLVG